MSRYNWYPVSGMTNVQIYTGTVSIQYRDTTTYRYTAHPYRGGQRTLQESVAVAVGVGNVVCSIRTKRRKMEGAHRHSNSFS